MDALRDNYLYWTGCAANYDARIASVVKSTAKVLTAAGIRLNYLGDKETCTGDAARRLGEEGLFQQLALQNIDNLKRHSVEAIVTHCAHCFHVLKNEYPRFGGTFHVYHHSEVIAQAIRENRIRIEVDQESKATLHDSCYVGRYNRIFDAPREILQFVNGKELVEMPRSAENSFCCGAGGANYWYDAPKKVSPGVIRIQEAARTGASSVVAECPFCIKMLELGAQALPNDQSIRVRDIAEVVADALLPSLSSDSDAIVPPVTLHKEVS